MSKEIHFTYSDSGTIDFGSGKDALSALFAICALIETRKLRVNGADVTYEYATDKAGLDALFGYSESTVELLLGMVQSLSILLTTANIDDFENELKDVYWLVAGLTGLAGRLAKANAEILRAINTAETGQ